MTEHECPCGCRDVVLGEWKCVDCGHESDSRFLMCPECTTQEDWAEARRMVQAMRP